MKKIPFLLLLAFVLTYILPLGVRPMFIPDESRYAEIPREMLTSGDWIVPRLNGMRYFEKPVLGYWINAASIALLGENNMAIRLPSALSVAFSVILLSVLMRRFGRSPWQVAVGAAILLTSALFFVVGTYNVLDAPLTLFLTATMVFFFFAYRAESVGHRALWLVLTGIACGCAFLTKGFLAMAVPAVVIVPFLLWERRWKNLFSMPWIPLAAIIACALPWALMVHAREPDFWHYFFWVEHIKRFASEKAQHEEPFWYFLPVLAAGLLPWTLLLPAAGSGLRKAPSRDPLFRYAVCWFVFPFLFFSASSGKLGTYILPCFPPAALLIAWGLTDYLDTGKRRAFNIGSGFSTALAAGVCIVLAANEVLGFSGERIFLADEHWKILLASLGLVFWAASAFLATISADAREKVTLYALSPLFLMFLVPFLTPARVEAIKAPGAFLAEFSDRVGPDTLLVTDSTMVHLVCWTYKRNDVYLLATRGELTYGLSYEDSKHRTLSIEEFNELVRRHSSKGHVVLINEVEDWNKHWKGKLPVPMRIVRDRKYLYAEFRMFSTVPENILAAVPTGHARP